MKDRKPFSEEASPIKIEKDETQTLNGDRHNASKEKGSENLPNMSEVFTHSERSGHDLNTIDLKLSSYSVGETNSSADSVIVNNEEFNKTLDNEDLRHRRSENLVVTGNGTNKDKVYDKIASNDAETPLLQNNGHQYNVNHKEVYVSNERLFDQRVDEIFDRENNSKAPETSQSRFQNCLDDPPDGGWGWVVTFSAFMVGLILDGISFSFGVYFKELYVYYNESKSLTSWIISVLNGTYLAIGPLSSVLVSLYGCRKVAIFGAILSFTAFFLCTWSPNVQVMILLYGLLGGAGLGQMYLPTIVTVGHYFKKKRALATGIAVCGSGIGGFVFAPLSQFLIDKYTWKGAMWVISAITLNGVVVAALLRPIESHSKYKKGRLVTSETVKELEPASEVKACCDLSAIFDFSLLKSLTFLLYGCSCFLIMLGFFIPFTFIPDLVEDNGMTSQQGALLVAIIGIVNTLARVVVGWLADRPWADALFINSTAIVVGGATTVFVSYYKSFGLMATYCVIFGVAAAVFAALRPVILAELMGVAKLTSSFGLVTLFQGLSSFIGAPIAGAVTDITGNYKGAFYLAGATMLLSGAISFPLRKISEWENRRSATASPIKDEI